MATDCNGVRCIMDGDYFVVDLSSVEKIWSRITTAKSTDHKNSVLFERYGGFGDGLYAY